MMTLARARALIGAPTAGFPFGKTSKMPGYSYGVDAFACQRGSVLATDPRTPCSSCYARRNFYATWTAVITSRRNHQAAIANVEWSAGMVRLLEHYVRPLIATDPAARWFRMHDSGDLASEAHLAAICEVARAVPWLSIWLPTHEPIMVARWIRSGGDVPPNLVIRLSADYNGQRFDLDASPINRRILATFPTSTTHATPGEPVQLERRRDSIECRSYLRDHRCGSCRACWSPDVRNVSYPISGGAAAASRARRSAELRVL